MTVRIDKMGDVKDFGGKTANNWARVVSSCKCTLRWRIHGKQVEPQNVKYKNPKKP